MSSVSCLKSVSVAELRKPILNRKPEIYLTAILTLQIESLTVPLNNILTVPLNNILTVPLNNILTVPLNKILTVQL